jgi:hypothetical protein
MRAASSLLAAYPALAACASQPNRVNSTPPSSVSHLMPDNNVAATSDEAQNYCAQWGRGTQYRRGLPWARLQPMPAIERRPARSGGRPASSRHAQRLRRAR